MAVVLFILATIGAIFSIKAAVDTAKADAWDASAKMLYNSAVFFIILFYLYGRLFDISPDYFCSTDMGFLRKY